MPVTTFLKIPSLGKKLFFEAVFKLFYAFILALFPLKSYSGKLGEQHNETSDQLSDSERQTALEIKHAIRRASKYTPWNTRCLVQAIAAKSMLKKRLLKSTLYMGVAKEKSNTIKAHAWVRCGNIIVTGRKGLENYTIVSSFGDTNTHSI